MPAIDYAEVKSRITLREVVKLLGLREGERCAGNVRGCCPRICSASERDCRFNFPQNVWYCHRCKQGGGALELYMAVKCVGIYDAAVEVCDALGIFLPYLARSEVREPRKRPGRKKEVAADDEEALE